MTLLYAVWPKGRFDLAQPVETDGVPEEVVKIYMERHGLPPSCDRLRSAFIDTDKAREYILEARGSHSRMRRRCELRDDDRGRDSGGRPMTARLDNATIARLAARLTDDAHELLDQGKTRGQAAETLRERGHDFAVAANAVSQAASERAAS